MKRKLQSCIAYAAIILITVALDRITKIAASGFFEYEGESIVVIPGVLNFTYMLNEGAAAGMLADHRGVLMAFSTVAIAAVLLYLFLAKKLGMLMGIGLSMVAGGGIGNMIDRAASGAVVDFFDVTAVNFFPFNCIFNVADVILCVGCFILVLAFILEEVRESRAKKQKAPDAQSMKDGA